MDCEAKSPSSDILSSGCDDDIEENKHVTKIKLKLSNSMARVCDYCGKKFRNGKALGGHIRIHTQALKKQGMLKLQSESRRNEENICVDRGDQGMDKRMCPICPRVFPSVKSLLDHMRLHPEMSYRGLQPQSSYDISSSSDEEEEDDEKPNNKKMMVSSSIDLLKDLPNWSRTDKRGRGSSCEAARNLISLANSAGSSGRISETLAESTLRKKHDIIIDRKGKALVLSNSSSSSSKDNGPPDRRRIRFMCSTCGRVFPTFQALGGHRSSHNKYPTQSVSREALIEPHRCDICRKNFPSGQALGGHKRCHWSGSNAKLDPDGEVGPDPGSRQLLDPMDIDLNKLPLMDLDDNTSLPTPS